MIPESPYFARLFDMLGPPPTSYTVLDIETSGLDRRADYILHAGWVKVENCETVSVGSVVLNWPQHLNGYVLDDLSRRIFNTSKQMVGKGYNWDLNVLRRGLPVARAFEAVTEAISGSQTIVGHNLLGFDLPFLLFSAGRHSAETGGAMQDALIGRSAFDTGAMEKASRLDVFPDPGESLECFQARILKIRASVKWNLRLACQERLLLSALDEHEPTYDCRLSHLLLEEHRRLSGKSPTPEKEAAC